LSFFFLKRLLSFGCTSTWHTAHTNTYIKTELQKSVIHTLLILFRHVQGTWESCLSHAMTAVGKKIKKLRKSHMDPIWCGYYAQLSDKAFLRHYTPFNLSTCSKLVLFPPSSFSTYNPDREKIAMKIHTPSNTAFPEAAYLMHETCRRRLNKTVTSLRRHVCMYIV